MLNSNFQRNLQARAAGSRRRLGFTLIELMIVVAIVAVLAAIAYPSYTRYAFRARRADGHEMMMRVAAAQERFYTNFNKYADTMGALGFTAPAGCAVGDSEKCYYNVAIGALGAGNQAYTLTATPKGVQSTDKCLNLTLTNAGVKSQSGNETNGKCW